MYRQKMLLSFFFRFEGVWCVVERVRGVCAAVARVVRVGVVSGVVAVGMP